MASLTKLGFGFYVLVHAFLLFPNSVYGGSDDENNLLQGLNSYRQSYKLPPLVKNGKADCLADQIAEDMEDQPCTSSVPSAQVMQLADFPKHLKKCKINVSSTTDGLILPVCVRKLVPTLVLTNYTQSGYAKSLNNSKYTGAGLGSEDDWMVVVLTTNSPSGSFTGAAFRLSVAASSLGSLVVGFMSLLLLL